MKLRSAARVQVCAATRVRAERSEESFDLHVRAQRDAARYAAASTQAHALVDAARAVPFAPLLAEAQLLAGDLDDRRGEYAKAAEVLRDAAFTALGVGDDATALAAAALLVEITGYRLDREDESRFWDRAAQALVERDPSSRAVPRLHVSRGLVARMKGRYEEALVHARGKPS